MFDNRHCAKRDYELLVIETDRIINAFSKGDMVSKKQLDSYLDFIARFDRNIADKMRLYLYRDDISVEKKIKIINENIDVLKQQVLVDIYEHS